MSQTVPGTGQFDLSLAELESGVRGIASGPSGTRLATALERFYVELSAARFHLQPRDGRHPTMVAIIGGTGTGKSTLLNRLLGRDVSAASFRRTFTSGPVAVSNPAVQLPNGWLRLDWSDAPPEQLPARGCNDRLTVVRIDHPLLERIALVDTPDLDGDQPAHHALADRVFRWAQAVVFLVTPEKYQMTELPPYYRLAARYALPVVFVMNKADDDQVVEDFRRQLSNTHGVSSPRVFCLPRDDAAFDPPGAENLPALRDALAGFADAQPSSEGVSTRLSDLFSRLRDHILHPLLDQRRELDRIASALRELTTPQPDVNVAPVTQQLQRRLQQRSVLYLMGPQRVFDRVRQVPLMLARLPRHTWDLLRHGQLRANGSTDEQLPDDWRKTGPDFSTALSDQFTVLHSRIDDMIRSSPMGEAWIASDTDGYTAARIDATEAGRIADEELADLRAWLESRWNSTPRDTRVVQALLKVIPGGRKLVGLSEAAPYLLAVVVASHHAFFGPVDLLILGGFSLATWMSEKLSNEVASRTRRTSARIGQRYTELAARQIERTLAWLNRQAPSKQDIHRVLDRVERLQTRLAAASGR